MSEYLVISRGPVGPDFNGGSMTVWGLVTGLIKNTKINPKLIIFFEDRDEGDIDVVKTKEYLNNINLEYKLFFFRENNTKSIFLRNLLRFDYSFFFQTYLIQNEVKEYLTSLDIKKIYVYHYDSLTLVPKNLKNKTIAFLGDQMHEPRILRRKIFKGNFLSGSILDITDTLMFNLIQFQLFKNLKQIYFFAYYYSLKNKLFNYIRTPLENEISDSYYKNLLIKKDFNNLQNFQIILIGGLHGTVTNSGLHNLEDLLREYIDNKKVQFNIIGSGTLNPRLKYLQRQENVNFIGRVENLNSYLSDKKIILVPNKIVLGIRVRIITSLMYGLVIITHESNCKGIPELEDKNNCLIFKNNKELSIIIDQIIKGKINLLEISKAARNLYKEKFENIIVVKNILSQIT